MVDLVKKVHKRVGGDLEPGEQVLDARVVQPAGQALRQTVVAAANLQLAAPARMRIERHQAGADAAQRRALEGQGGLAAAFPTGKCFFTLTDRRVLVHSFAAMTGAPKDLLATYPLTAFATLETQQGTLTSKLTLWMADGTNVPLDVFRGGGDPHALAAAFDAALDRMG